MEISLYQPHDLLHALRALRHEVWSDSAESSNFCDCPQIMLLRTERQCINISLIALLSYSEVKLQEFLYSHYGHWPLMSVGL